MGQVWATDHISGNEDSAESHPFYGASGWRDSGIPWSYNRLFDSLIVVPEFREMYLRRLRTLMEEWLLPPGTPENQMKIEARIREMRARIEPEALLDRKKWGWPSGYGGYTMTNVPFGQAVDELLNQYVGQRRTHLFAVHSAANTAYTNSAGIPDSQPTLVAIRFGSYELTPSSGNPLEEYVELRNTNRFAVDLSGWTLSGAVSFTFKPGTVMPSGGSLYVSPDVKAFRNRATAPSGKQGRFVQGPYQGRLSARGETLVLSDNCRRVVDKLNWAPQPTVAQQALRITEIMYHPPPGDGAPFTPEDFEFLELKNISNTELDLTGVKLTAGVAFDFATASSRRLPAGASGVLVKNLAAFQSRYGSSIPVLGVYQGSLSNEGDTLRLEDGAGEIVSEFAYDPSWYPTTDGLGFSLVVADEQASVDRWDLAAQWRPSGQILGSPGQPNAGNAIPPVRINEILASSAGAATDAIELYNPVLAPAAIGGWFLSDDPAQPRKYRIPTATVIQPGGYWVVTETQFNGPAQGTNAFALSASGDQLYLFSADLAGNLTGYSDAVRFGASDPGMTLGRWTDSLGRSFLVAQAQPTLGSANGTPEAPNIVVSELFYHGDDYREEYFELLNTSSSAILFQDAAHPENRWRVRGDIDFDFPDGFTLEPSATVVVVGFDPLVEPERAQSFRTAFRVGNADPIRLLGPYRGSFSHGNGKLRLERPGTPTTSSASGAVSIPWRVVDSVEYRDQAPWPILADGFGAALARRDLRVEGVDPSAWIAAAPSPGFWIQPGIVPQIIAQPSGLRPLLGQQALLSVTAESVETLSYQWIFNGKSLPGAVDAQLDLSPVRLADAGCYEVVIMSSGGVVRSELATMEVGLGPLISLQPTNRLVAAGTNLTLRAAAIGQGPIRYQWLWNNLPLLGSTNASLTLSNIQTSQSGSYRVQASDDRASVLSDAAIVTAAIRASVAIAPQSMTVVGGETAVFSVTANGSLPISFRWRKGAVTLTNVTLNSSNAFLVLANVQPSQTGNYSVSLANILGTASVAPSFSLSILADTDGDRMPDVWETAHGLDPKTADGGSDPDGDGATNWEEYQADTDPLDASQQLRLSISLLGGAPALDFESRSNRTYSVQFSESLEGSTWQSLSDIVARSTNHLERVLDLSPSGGPRYYRVVTPWQP